MALSPKAFDLLHLLVKRHGCVLDKHALLDALWPDTFVEEANLSVQAAAVRKALGPEGAWSPDPSQSCHGWSCVGRWRCRRLQGWERPSW